MNVVTRRNDGLLWPTCAWHTCQEAPLSSAWVLDSQVSYKPHLEPLYGECHTK